MTFHAFKELLPKIQQSPLIGDEAHFLMAPDERKFSMASYREKNYQPRLAAVSLLFYPKNQETHIVFIKRAVDLSVHSGQIAFPGGKKEIEDANEEVTALRELAEEVGIHSHQVSVIKKLSPLYVPPSNFEVHPFMLFADTPLTFKPQLSEVAHILEIPLANFLTANAIGERLFHTSYGKNIKCPIYRWQEQMIWGATAMMMSEMREIILREL